ncbi:MAG: type II toxin-antitoxin system VapC family toxin [Candidatus Hydrogenedentes bacterium]|nr:type II toxin-antitoxin system VapC family toxin [Candidatus Hydrogenedentota bacterium]
MKDGLKGRPMRVYVDTSVFGGAFDAEFSNASEAFFSEVRSGRFRVAVSDVVVRELGGAPDRVVALYGELEGSLEILEMSEAALGLVRAYLAAGIVAERWRADALHVALAAASGCLAIVSWNFRHIVHFEKIPLYNGVNMTHGFGPLAIHTPQEMLHYEDQDKDV